LSENKLNAIKAVFAKYGGRAELNALYKGTKHEKELEIKEQPTGLSMGWDGLCHIVSSNAKDERQIFVISCVGTWATLTRAGEYQKQLAIAISLLKDLKEIDPALTEYVM
jgi:hypothetical protein